MFAMSPRGGVQWNCYSVLMMVTVTLSIKDGVSNHGHFESWAIPFTPLYLKVSFG